MGSDNFPYPEVQAAQEAAQVFNEEILLVGQEERLKPLLAKEGNANSLVKIIHAPEVLEMTDKPSASARRKAQNSMAVGMELLTSGEGDAFVTAGNTGGAMATGLFRLGRIKGVKRPALCAIIPVKNGRCAVLDVGANTECKPEYLVQFGLMGSVYVEKILGVNNPRVGLLSNGEEAGKGNDLVKETYPLLVSSGLNFVGNIEGKELFGGEADIVVTDGFTGNIVIKISEAIAKFITDRLKEELMGSFVTKIGGLLARPAFSGLRKDLDPNQIGAIPLLGINGLIFVGHGRSNAQALVSGIQQARQAVEADLLTSIRSTIENRISALKV
jgi:glycerol-3-phosphate acyltransferase PlsX